MGFIYNESLVIGFNIVFDRGFINVGRGFNVNIGVFIVVVGGIYVFYYYVFI